MPEVASCVHMDNIRAAVSKITIFGQETWNLKQSARSYIYILFLPQGVEIELIFALRAAVSEIF